jgi:hypothetical protein
MCSSTYAAEIARIELYKNALVQASRFIPSRQNHKENATVFIEQNGAFCSEPREVDRFCPKGDEPRPGVSPRPGLHSPKGA